MNVAIQIGLILWSIRGCISVLNLLFSEQLSSSKKEEKTEKSTLSILIPARNEEERIVPLLQDLESICRKEEILEVCILDDHSEDDTAQVVEKFRLKNAKIKLLPSQNLPENWTGKNFACHQLGTRARGEFLLFLDADIRLKEGAIEALLQEIKIRKASLVSVFPGQIMLNRGENYSVPLMFRILLGLLPLRIANKLNFVSMAAANGQCMLFLRNDYVRLQPHAHHRDRKVEDIEIARYFRSKNLKTQVLLGRSLIQCRMYSSFQEAKTGFSKNLVAMMLGSKLFVLFWWILPLSLLMFFFTQSIWMGLTLFMLFQIPGILNQINSGSKLRKSLIYALPVTLGFFIISINALTQKNTVWKGRNV